MFRTTLTVVSASFGLIVGLGIGAAFGTIVSLSAYFYNALNESLWHEAILFAQKRIPKMRIELEKPGEEEGAASQKSEEL